MSEVSIIGVDLAKRIFQVHGAGSNGEVVFRKKLSRAQMLKFFFEQPVCIVAMEACGGAHHWAREITKFGHTVKLIPPIYVKPFVKRQKNDMADAEAIAEAASRPTMRFVEVKSTEQQAHSMVFRTRDLLVRQRTQMVNALRGHLAEYGVVAPQGIANINRLSDEIYDKASKLPAEVRALGVMILEQIAFSSERIKELERDVRKNARANENAQRLMSIPGIGPISAMAVQAFAPAMESFRKGRDFAAWVGLVPKQKSTGGKTILGKTSKMGQRDIRRLLIIGAMSVIRASIKKPPPETSWLYRMLLRKPRILVATALANKMARMIWALTMKQEFYRNPVKIA